MADNNNKSILLDDMLGQQAYLLITNPGFGLYSGVLGKVGDCYTVGEQTFSIDSVRTIQPKDDVCNIYVDELGAMSRDPIDISQVTVTR